MCQGWPQFAVDHMAATNSAFTEESGRSDVPPASPSQVVDRPTQGHRFLSRQYVQPQWVLDAANWRVLPDPGRYAPGVKPPPHLSPFVNNDDEGYVPDYAAELRRLQARRGLQHACQVLRLAHGH